MSIRQGLWCAGVLFATVGVGAHLQAAQTPVSTRTAVPAAVEPKAMLDKYCVTCHTSRSRTPPGNLAIDKLDITNPGADAEVWEKIIKKLHGGAMPPVGMPRPEAGVYKAFIASLESAMDRTAKAAPNPGRPPVHRLNRLQYTNAVRDVFGLEIDGKTMLPPDDAGFGFDNIGDVLSVSPGLLDRYLIAATKISRLVVGDPAMRPVVSTYSFPYLSLSRGQDDRMSEELPFGSRGGAAIEHYFPLDGEYSLKFFLQRGELTEGAGVRGMDVPSQIDVRLDRVRLKQFVVGGRGDKYDPETGLEVRFRAKAGTHVVGITMNQDNWDMEGVGVSRLPLTNSAYARGKRTSTGSGRIDVEIESISVGGPYGAKASAENPVRQRLFVCQPATPAEEDACARRILSTLARRAYRRPPNESDLQLLMGFYRDGNAEGGFANGIQTAITRLLVDVNFLFQLERDPAGVTSGTPYRVSDVALATRLAFFLWSSIPDEALLSVAEKGQLKNPAVLEQQVRRMLLDSKASAFIDSFFGQWLTTRNVSTARPDAKAFPEFDDNLRDAFLRETQLFIESQIRENRSVLELFTANYTFVNERLARHYGIPNVEGSHFRRVALPDESRAGLFGHGSVLTVTSYVDRTSVVMRGKWIMETLLGIPPPPPPADVPPLEATEIKGTLRQRMELHRKNAVCATCHSQIDPLGFALENFDGTGKFRTMDGGAVVDPSGVLVDGTKFSGPASFREALLKKDTALLTTLTEKLLTYALGRGVEPYDMPAVRQILREAAPANYRWSAMIVAIAKSLPFQMRRAES